MRIRLIILASFLMSACAATPPSPSPSPSPSLLYVCNQSDATVTLIDTKTNSIVRTVDLKALGFGPNAKPHHVAVESDGSYWYVTLIGENVIVKLDRNDRVVGTAEFETPGMLALDPLHDLLYVGRSMTAVNPPKRIGVIHRSDMSIDEIDVVFPRPHAMAVDGESGTVYTGSLAVNQMAAVDEASERVVLTDVAGAPHSLMQFAISPDGKRLAASGELSHQLLLFDIANRMKPQFMRSWNVEAQPFDPVFTRDGRYIALGNKAADAITIIDTKTNAVKVLSGAGVLQPHGSAVSNDGRWIYISCNNLNRPAGAHAGHDMGPLEPAGPGTVVVIDARTLEIAKVIEVGHNAAGIAVRTQR